MSEPDYDPEIPYSVTFPLPFRVLSLVGLGILGWAANLHGLEKFGIDGPTVLELRTTNDTDTLNITSPRLPDGFRQESSVYYKNIYRLGFIYFACLSGVWILYLFLSRGDPGLVDMYGFFPGLFTIALLLVVASPFRMFYKHERESLLWSFQRCLFITMNSPVYFADVVFADILTSFARVLGDVFMIFRMLYPGNSMLVKPSDHGWIRWLAPTIMSLPFFVRFRQCVVEWNSPKNESNRPLYNALKYATAFPVIYLSAAQVLVESGLEKPADEQVLHGEHPLFRMWLLAAVVNSLYSFWWDITNDWGLKLLKPKSDKPPIRLELPRLHSGSSLLRPDQSEDVAGIQRGSLQPFGLRSRLLYPLPVYPLIVFLNFVLRMTWTVRLSSHIHSKSDGSMIMFLIEAAEILRRWMWVFIRVEWEAIKREGHLPERSPGVVGNMVDYELFPRTPDEPTIVIGDSSDLGKFS